ncbi:hypothetical protein B6D60_06925 [candidate division KSB1 bacterium 4484_87]|nr:MAG: hypothetical protein B6D60_06925 [candidate division KSB1 bacterium 4484_87]
MIIGLTGTNAAGKTEFVHYLETKGFTSYSLSDIIREELEARKLPLSRQNLIEVGNELRREFGPSVLADRTKEKIKDNKVVIDSIRNPAEILSLRELPNFFMVSIDAPPELRYQRAKERGRIEDVDSLDQFIAMENREKSDDAHEQNLSKCMRMAEFRIINSGSRKEFYKEIDHTVSQVELRLRPTWKEYFMKMAFLVAERSTCLRHHVGAIIVKNRHVLTTGYNGAARKTNDCLRLGCLRNQLNIPSGERHEICRAIHAEQNAIIQAGVHGVSIEGATLYCTHFPCIICAKMIVNAGIKKVVVAQGYPDKYNLVMALFDEARVEVEQVPIPDNKIRIVP